MNAPTKDRVKGTFQSASGVREMFDRVAPRYDLLNHLLSLNIDRLWRSAVAREFREVLSRADARALDLCCGTGDLTLALHDTGPAQVIGADFCHPMLVLAASKFAKAAERRPPPVLEADALQLPFPDSSFDLITVAFGFRNLADYDGGLREMFRLLRPGGRIGILEFSEVTGLLGPLYRFYFSRILPRLGSLISHHSGAYLYLPASVAQFLAPDELADRMRTVGFSDVHYRRFTFGIACLHVGTRRTA
jgi:demethylmenaquinone methyltransferase/2-methoxy-6-polyprenyl-1,4-benzoquinol methylase